MLLYFAGSAFIVFEMLTVPDMIDFGSVFKQASLTYFFFPILPSLALTLLKPTWATFPHPLITPFYIIVKMKILKTTVSSIIF